MVQFETLRQPQASSLSCTSRKRQKPNSLTFRRDPDAVGSGFMDLGSRVFGFPVVCTCRLPKPPQYLGPHFLFGLWADADVVQKAPDFTNLHPNKCQYAHASMSPHKTEGPPLKTMRMRFQTHDYKAPCPCDLNSPGPKPFLQWVSSTSPTCPPGRLGPTPLNPKPLNT